MSPKFGSYLFRNPKGQASEGNSGSDSLGAFGAFEEQPILLRQEDIGTDDPKAPSLNWSAIENGQITVALKETQGITEGSVTIRASTLHRICPLLLSHPLEQDYLFPVSLKTVVLQIREHLQLQATDVAKTQGADFDTPIAQVAREDEGFFKLEKGRQPPARPAPKPETGRISSEPFLTPADRPSFPLIREKQRPAKVDSEAPPLEIAVQDSFASAFGTTPTPASKAGLFAELPKIGPEAPSGKRPTATSPPPAGERKQTVEDGVETSDRPGPSKSEGSAASKPPRRAGLERLQEIFMTDDLLDAREVATLIARFPKVRGALIFLGDGTLMGGELPTEFKADAAVFAPTIMRTLQEFGRRLKSQEPSAVTIFMDEPVSLCAAGNVGILVAHQGRGLLPGMRERIGEVAKALDLLYGAELDSNP